MMHHRYRQPCNNPRTFGVPELLVLSHVSHCPEEMTMLLAYLAFAIGVASPGPSVLAVMGMAMAQGRKRALVLASGVVSGSLFWGLCAALGMAALMQRYAAALTLVKVAGGLYLLWMAWQAARKALRGTRTDAGADAGPAPGYGSLYLRGAAMHLTNPKAVVVWLSVVSLALLAGVFGYAGLRMLLSASINTR
jgi:threonine efflux protein